MSFHTPHHPAKRKRRLRPDWATVAAFSAFLLVLALVWGLIRTLEQNDALVEQGQKDADSISSLTGEVHDLRVRLGDVNDAARADRRKAAAERDKLLRQQAVMIRILRKADLITPGTMPSGIVVIDSGNQPSSQSGNSGGQSQPSGPKGNQGGSNGGNNGGSNPGGGGGQPSTPGPLGPILDLPCQVLPGLPTC